MPLLEAVSLILLQSFDLFESGFAHIHILFGFSPSAVAVLKDCMKNVNLVQFFQERQSTLNHFLPLETYLLKPVQRILKYHLLLQVS